MVVIFRKKVLEKKTEEMSAFHQNRLRKMSQKKSPDRSRGRSKQGKNRPMMGKSLVYQ